MQTQILMKIILFILLFLVHIHADGQTGIVHKPGKMAIDSKDNLYVSIRFGIVKISPKGEIEKITDRRFDHIAIDRKDNIYLAESEAIYQLKFKSNGEAIFEPYAGLKNTYGHDDGKRESARFNAIEELHVGLDGELYVLEKAIYLIKSVGDNSGKWHMQPLPKTSKPKNWYYLRKISDGKVSSAKNAEGQYLLLNNVSGMAVDKNGNIFFSGGGYSRAIQKLEVSDNTFSTVAGKPYKRESCPVYTPGDMANAELFDPGLMIWDKAGNLVYTDNRSHRITRVGGGKVVTLSGNNIIDSCSQNIGGRAQENHKDGPAAKALFNFPKGLAYDSKGNLYIADTNNNCIRKLSPDGIVSSFTVFNRENALINKY